MNGVNLGSPFFQTSSAHTWTGAQTLSAILTLTDDILLRLGTDGDQVLLNRSTTLNANTALTSVLIGTPVTPALTANSLIIANATADSDILIVGNDGGHSRVALYFDASTPDTYLYNVGGTWTAGATTWTIPAFVTSGITASANIDIGGYDIRALSGTFDSLTAGRVPFASTNGLLVDDADFTFSVDTLTVKKIGATTLTGALTLGGQEFAAGAGNAIIGSSASLILDLQNTNATSGPRVRFYHSHTTPELNTYALKLDALGYDGNATPALFAWGGIEIDYANITDTTEAASFQIILANAGAEYNQALTLSGAGALWTDLSVDTLTYKVSGTQVVRARVIDAKCDDTINAAAWDATTAGVLTALRDAMVTHGLVAASA